MIRLGLILMILTGVILAKPVVTTSILPTAFFVERIGGNDIEVNSIVRANADPHSFEPKVSDMKKLELSNIFFAVGIEYEDVWLDKFSKAYPNLKIIKTQGENIKYNKISHHNHDHHHDHHDHSHDEFDTHIWLDPIMVKDQAKIIAQALSQKYPQNAKIYSQNLDKFLQDIDKLDAYIKDSLKDIKNRKFMVFHPSWGYFAKRYHLIQIAIESGGKEPKPAALAGLIKKANQEDIKVIFVSPGFSQKSAQLIAEQTGAKLIEIDHLSKDWLNNMYKIAQIFKNSL
ncbi:zinc ABC transporter ZnuABC, periplasmic zinc-binding protein [Campylobacter vicugnae]|uniref:Zinc ABC transporter ZnuABC, periplasmic zinc-binding protein n=1 Tax=Campylobacter vicugnae TaxID=1660076 RepID=A0A1X9T3M1_9BACT|nr:zinc ABC transporter substrate-binding protein [Campylobacter sp. RM8964]ARR02979.1 zinc ABC transporter ZnuABC, periplasmic zinc-binding protein [Campylobacter sp. RM8964]